MFLFFVFQVHLGNILEREGSWDTIQVTVVILVFSCSCFDIYFCCWALCKNVCTKSFVPLLVATTLTAAPTGRRIFDSTAETISINCQSPQYSFHHDLISSFSVRIAVSLITFICSWNFSIMEENLSLWTFLVSYCMVRLYPQTFYFEFFSLLFVIRTPINISPAEGANTV